MITSLIITCIALIATQGLAQATTIEYEPNYIEVERTQWGPYFIVRELNENRAAVEFYPDSWEQHRILGADEQEFAVVANYRIANVSLVDVDGDALVDVVFTGNSGGMTGCCEFIEVWTFASGEPSQAFRLYGGRGNGDGFEVIAGAVGDPLPIKATQYLYLGDIPFCCLPSVPRAFTWNGQHFRDVTRTALPARVGESLGENRATVRYLARSAETQHGPTLEAAAISAYAAAVLLGQSTADRELRTMRELLPPETFVRLADLTHEIEEAIWTWVRSLAN